MKRKVIMAIAAMAAISPATAMSLCFTDCQATTARLSFAPQFSQVGKMNDSYNQRERSHNTGDVKNSVMGDMEIRVGHEKLDIKMDGGTSNSTVNASVNSTIILGDMNK